MAVKVDSRVPVTQHQITFVVTQRLNKIHAHPGGGFQVVHHINIKIIGQWHQPGFPEPQTQGLGSRECQPVTLLLKNILTAAFSIMMNTGDLFR